MILAIISSENENTSAVSAKNYVLSGFFELIHTSAAVGLNTSRRSHHDEVSVTEWIIHYYTYTSSTTIFSFLFVRT